MKSRWIFFFIFYPLSLNASLDADRDEILERIKPVGSVYVEEQKESASTTISQPAASTPRTGQSIYEQHCIVCHAEGLAGAPKFRDPTSWNPRLAKSSIDQLVAIAIKGLNAMPPKGTCQECSESDIKSALEYMVPKK